jgi:hypothetical protein
LPALHGGKERQSLAGYAINVGTPKRFADNSEGHDGPFFKLVLCMQRSAIFWRGCRRGRGL